MLPWATMMIGQTDDSFEAVDSGLAQDERRRLSPRPPALQSQLSSNAQRNEQVVVWVTLLGLLISVVVAIVISRSIVRPIRANSRTSSASTCRPANGASRWITACAATRSVKWPMPSTYSARTSSTRTRSTKTLAESHQVLAEGFSLYEGHAEDKLVVCNCKWGEMFSYGPDTVIPGMSFERIVGSAVGRVVVEGAGDGQAWLRPRLEQHRRPGWAHS